MLFVYTDGDLTCVGDPHRFSTQGDIVTLPDAPQTISGKDIIVVMNGNWYQIDVSEDDKNACGTGFTMEVEITQPKIPCERTCENFEEHHYYVRLRQEWKIESPVVERIYRFKKRAATAGAA